VPEGRRMEIDGRTKRFKKKWSTPQFWKMMIALELEL